MIFVIAKNDSAVLFIYNIYFERKNYSTKYIFLYQIECLIRKKEHKIIFELSESDGSGT